MSGVKGRSGGRRPNQTGRPPLPPGQRLCEYRVRLPAELWRWYRLRGGSALIRAVLVAHQRASEENE